MIKIREYIRTRRGEIDKVIIEYNGKCNSRNCNCKHISCKNNYYDEEDIIEHSKNIIDLIEVGDLIKFKNKLTNSLENEEMIIHIINNDTLEEVKTAIKNKEIEMISIVTKEQFTNTEYKVNT